MAEEGSIGLPTPSKNIQDALTKIQKELSKNKTDWEINRNIFESLLKERKAEPLIDTTSLLIITNHGISKLGVELTETHERLAKVEKAISELKLKLK